MVMVVEVEVAMRAEMVCLGARGGPAPLRCSWWSSTSEMGLTLIPLFFQVGKLRQRELK